MAAGLPFSSPEAVKNTVALARGRWDGWSTGSFASRRATRWVAVAILGELFAAAALLANHGVPPVLLRSLQLFLRF